MSSEVPEPRNAEPSGPSSPRRIARFVVLGQLGRGGMGVVYEAWDPKLERRVALKLLPPEQRREEARNRLVREAQALARLAHPNVVAVYDVDVEGEAVWIAMEFVEGSTLRSWLKAEPRSVPERLDVLHAAGEGLAAAHAAGLVHRDFKPDNVLVGRDGRVRVVDFGLVRASDEPTQESFVEPAGDLRITGSSRSSQQITRVGALVGTPGYMAPEQLRGKPADARADQFAFCVVVWEALFGILPFEGADLASLREAIESGRIRTPRRELALPDRMMRALARGLAVAPDQRFPDMQTLLGELHDDAPRRRGVWLVLALVLVLLFGGLAAWWSRESATEQCAAGRVAAQQLWEQRRRTSIAERFVSEVPDAGEASFARVDIAIGAWSQAWEQAYTRTCEARDEQPLERWERRMDCLERQRIKVDAWLEALLDADAELVREVPARMAWLPSSDACLVVEGGQTLAAPPPDRRDAVGHVRDELAQIEARMLVRGIASLAPALAELRERALASEYEPVIAELLRVEGKLALAEDDLARASEKLREAYALALASGHDSLALTCAIELIEADTGSDAAQHLAIGTRWHAGAAALSERLGHPPEAELELHLAFAGLLRGDTRYDEALVELDAATRIVERLAGPDSFRALEVERQRSAVLQSAGRYAEARVGIDRVIAGQEALVGPEHPFLLAALGTRGNIAIAEGRHDDGLRDALRMREISERSYGPTHARTLRAVTGMATMHSLRGEQAAARATFEDLLARLGEREQVSSKSGAHATMGLCATVLELEDLAAASEVCPRAAEAARRFYGEMHPVVAVASSNLALLARLAGEPELSLAYEHAALHVCEQSLEPQHPYVGFAWLGVAESLLMLGRPRDALAPALRALALRADSHDLGEVAEARCLVARALGDRERVREALRELERAGNKQRQAKACAASLE